MAFRLPKKNKNPYTSKNVNKIASQITDMLENKLATTPLPAGQRERLAELIQKLQAEITNTKEGEVQLEAK